MPRGFTPNQSQIIRKKLIDCALVRIQETGIRKTSVESLAQAASISAGAFYKFYPSKEALFFEVYELLENQLRADFLSRLEAIHGCDLKALKQATLAMLSSDSMQRLLTLMRKDELEYLLMNVDPEILRRHQQSDAEYLQEVLQRLHACGIQAQIGADVLIAYLQALFILCYGKDQLAPYADRVLDTFLDSILAELSGRRNIEEK